MIAVGEKLDISLTGQKGLLHVLRRSLSAAHIVLVLCFFLLRSCVVVAARDAEEGPKTNFVSFPNGD